MAKKMTAKAKELNSFMNEFLEASIRGGIATENPTAANLEKFSTDIVRLKRKRCYITSEEEYKKTMPFYNEVEEAPLKYAETGRHALREVAKCSIKAILTKQYLP